MSLSIENVQVEGAFQKLPEPVKPTVIQNIQTKTKPISSKNQIFDNKLIINNFLIIKRKKYSMFSSEVKKKCIEASMNNDLKAVSKMFSVPLKSLKRWIKVGPERKKGGGRKIRDPEMEKKLFAWYNQLKTEGVPVTPKMIKQKALSITKFKDFIASKGWLEKFKRKFKLELSRENKDSCTTVNSARSISISTIVTPQFKTE